MKSQIVFLLTTFIVSAFTTQLYAQIGNESLPFKISQLKQLDSAELADKREGTYVTGVPDISIDPINGFGYGAEGSIIFNGNKENPFFNYTPYLTKLDVALFNTSNQQRELIITLDKPYIFKSKWRLRGELAYEINPNLLYFGLTDNTLNSLATLSAQDKMPRPPFGGQFYKQYTESLGQNQTYFNNYTKEEYILNVSGEYAMMDSKMRLIVGGELAGLNISTRVDSVSRLQRDRAENHILGVGKSTITFFQLGLVYDTRDFEPDPNRGIFAEITNEFSSKALGSSFNMDKLFAQAKGYKKLLPGTFKKLVFAARAGIGYTFGGAPFFEYQDEWSSEGSIEGLGGNNTLRGFKQSRFLSRGMYFMNAELRARFAKAEVLKQHLVFSAVPFFDAGSVYNSLSDIFNTSTLKTSEGLGLRIAWNLSTILRFDYAVSSEDRQFFFTFGQAF